MTLERHREMTPSALAARPGLAAARTRSDREPPASWPDHARRGPGRPQRQAPSARNFTTRRKHPALGDRHAFALPQVLAAALPNAWNARKPRISRTTAFAWRGGSRAASASATEQPRRASCWRGPSCPIGVAGRGAGDVGIVTASSGRRSRSAGPSWEAARRLQLSAFRLMLDFIRSVRLAAVTTSAVYAYPRTTWQSSAAKRCRPCDECRSTCMHVDQSAAGPHRERPGAFVEAAGFSYRM
jgi:hypothetical protein